MIIYKITNICNGKIYIGQTIQTLKLRWYKHVWDSNNKLKTKISLAIKKYGDINFKVEEIDCCSSREELDEKEKYWIKTLKSLDRTIGYNVMDGGRGGPKMYGKDNPRFGKPNENLIKLAKLRIGKKQTAEHVANRVKAQKGQKRTAESKLKFSIIRKEAWSKSDIYTSDSYKEKLRNRPYSTYNRDNNTRSVMCLENMKVYKSIKECGSDLGIKSEYNIRKQILGELKKVGGYTFKYL